MYTKHVLPCIATLALLISLDARAGTPEASISAVEGNVIHACFAHADAIAAGVMLTVERHSMESRPPKSVATVQRTPRGTARIETVGADGCAVAELVQGLAAPGDWLQRSDD
jgi:hypothetical protein